MNIKENIQKMSELRQSIKDLYSELNALEKEIVSELKKSGKEKGFKTLEISESEQADLVWAFEKRIDYDRLKKEHPKIYEMGLETRFNQRKALMSIESNALLQTVLKDYTTIDGDYKIKISKIKKRKVTK